VLLNKPAVHLPESWSRRSRRADCYGKTERGENIGFDGGHNRHPTVALAAELTNHLFDGAVLIPGAAGTLPELQQVGFHYAT
jgi:hypothetical protein